MICGKIGPSERILGYLVCPEALHQRNGFGESPSFDGAESEAHHPLCFGESRTGLCLSQKGEGWADSAGGMWAFAGAIGDG